MDPIADMLTRIMNAARVRREVVAVPLSKLKEAIAELLVREGYLVAINKRGKRVKKSLLLDLAYDAQHSPRIHGVKRISKPSRRVYMRAQDIRPVRSGVGTLVLSTPQGVVTGKEAWHAKVGGEVLFEIW